MTDPDNGVTQYFYDELNRLEAVLDPVNRRSETVYDAEGQVLQELRGVGSPDAIVYATRTWTPNGQLDWVEDANDNRSDLLYDGFDRLARLSFPQPALGAHAANDNDYEAYGYDANGNRVSLRLRSGETIGYHYDALNRECFKDLPSLVADPNNECSHEIAGAAANDVFSGYDLAGRRVYARYPGSFAYDVNCNTAYTGVDYCYDAVGRLSAETSYGRRLEFQYDQASNRVRVTHPDSVYFQYSYDALNRVDQVQLNGSAAGLSLVADYAYDAQSRRISLSRGNGAATTYGYTNASRLNALVHNLEGAATANDANWSFGYNAAGQVTSRTLVQVYERTVAALSEAYQGNGLNQYTNVGGVAFAYAGDDGARGNLTSDGARNFDYDVENRLIVVSGSVSGSLSYDPLGRLRSYTTGGTTTEFLYDGDRLVAEFAPGQLNAPLRRYVHGPGVDEPLLWYEGAGTSAGQNWLIADRQGSIIATTNASGAATTYGYDPYGIPREWAGPRFRYTGQAILPELRLYHYKARAYDPVLGRFLQTDPVGYAPDLNLYTYARNDAVNGADPSGMRPGDRFTDARAAAIDALDYINPRSREENVEYSGGIRRDADGMYYATEPRSYGRGTNTPIPVWEDGSSYGDYHTHGDYSRRIHGQLVRTDRLHDTFDSDQFSRGAGDFSVLDRAADASGNEEDYRSYLGTPSGEYLEYDSNTHRVTNVGQESGRGGGERFGGFGGRFNNPGEGERCTGSISCDNRRPFEERWGGWR